MALPQLELILHTNAKVLSCPPKGDFIMTQKTWTQAEMERRLVRYADLKGLRNAFIDARTPGSDRKENFTIIGPGVSENPAQVVHIPEAHGFNERRTRPGKACARRSSAS